MHDKLTANDIKKMQEELLQKLLRKLLHRLMQSNADTGDYQREKRKAYHSIGGRAFLSYL